MVLLVGRSDLERFGVKSNDWLTELPEDVVNVVTVPLFFFRLAFELLEF
jgi:hypothetical protein